MPETGMKTGYIFVIANHNDHRHTYTYEHICTHIHTRIHACIHIHSLSHRPPRPPNMNTGQDVQEIESMVGLKNMRKKT